MDDIPHEHYRGPERRSVVPAPEFTTDQLEVLQAALETFLEAPFTCTDEQRPVANQLRAYIGLRLNLAAVGR